MDTKNALEALRTAYKEQGDLARHYSTIRSALTTFLLAAALAALSEYQKQATPLPFLLAAGFILLTAAFVVCLIFSYRTEKTLLRYKEYWSFINGERPPEVGIVLLWHKQSDAADKWNLRREAALRMTRDPINWLLVAGIGVVIWAVKNPQTLKRLLEYVQLT